MQVETLGEKLVTVKTLRFAVWKASIETFSSFGGEGARQGG